jgi:hypothetical protein
VLYINSSEFTSRILAILTSDTTSAVCFFRFVRRPCELSRAAAHRANSLFKPLFEAVARMLERTVAGTDARTRLKPLVSALRAYPAFLRMVLDRQGSFTDLLLSIDTECGSLPTQDALIACFDAHFAEDTEPTATLSSNITAPLIALDRRDCCLGEYRRRPF